MLLLGGALLLVALYVPWRRLDLSEFGEPLSLLGLFGGAEALEGWDSGVAPAAALAALLLVGLAAVAFARPALTTRLPLGRCALVAAYFGVAIAADTHRDEVSVFNDEAITADARFAYGAYLGLGAAVSLLLAALVLRRAELRQLRSPFAVAAALLASALLLVLLLPWGQFHVFQFEVEIRGIAAATGPVAAVVVICTPTAPRSLALLAGLFTAATFTVAATPEVERGYGAWLGIGLAIALVAL